MKTRKVLCLALSVMLILAAFPAMVFADVTQSPYTQEALLSIDFDDYTEGFDYSTAVSDNKNAAYEDLVVGNFQAGRLNVTLTPVDRDGGKAISYTAEAGENEEAALPEICWSTMTYKGNAFSFGADLDFSASAGKTGVLCDIQVKSAADGGFIASRRAFSFVRTEDGVYLANAEKIVEGTLIPDGWHRFNMVVNTIDGIASMYMDGVLLDSTDLAALGFDLSGGLQSPRFGALNDLAFSFDNITVKHASGFYGAYDNVTYKADDAYLFDAYVSDDDFGSGVYLYAGDALLDYTTEKVSGEAYRFEGVIPSTVPVGNVTFKLVTVNGGAKTIRDSFTARIISVTDTEDNTHNFDSIIDGETVTEGTAVDSANSGISSVAGNIFTYTNEKVGANSSTKIKATVPAETKVVTRVIYDSYPNAGGVHEVEFDWYPINTTNSFIGMEVRPNNYKFDYPGGASAHYKVIRNNKLYDGDERTLEQKWYHMLCRVYLEPDLRYEFYLDGELVGSGAMTAANTNGVVNGLRIDLGRMKAADETTELCYLDNISWRNYQISDIEGEVNGYAIGSASYDAESAVVPAPATKVYAALSKALTVTGAYVKDANGQTVSDATVSVNGTDVTAILGSVLSAGDYKIVIPSTATYEDGTAIGSNVEIPFEMSSEFVITSPANGEAFGKNDTVKLQAYVPDSAKSAALYVDGEYVTTLTATDNFVTYNYDASDDALGTHSVKFVYDGNSYTTTFITEYAASTDVGALNNFNGSGAKPLSVGAQAKHITQGAIVDGNGSKAMAAYVKHTLEATDDSGKIAAKAGSKSHLTTLVARSNANTRENNLYVIEEDMWFGNINDTYYYECSYNMPVPENKFYLYANDTLTMATLLDRPYWNTYILQNGKIGNMVAKAETWYSLKTVFDFDNGKYYIYVDGELVTAEEGLDLAYINITGKAYYYNDTDETVTTENSTKIDASNVNEILGDVKGISGINAYHSFGSKVSYNAHGDEGLELYHKVLMRDNPHIYTQIRVPSITAYEENAPMGTSALSVTFDSPYDAASVASKEGIKVYVDGVDTAYTTAAIEGNVVTVTLAEAVKENQKVEVVFLDTLLLKDGASEAGATNKATLYGTKDGLYIGSTVTFAEGKANAKIICKNYGESAGTVLAALSGKADNELKVLDADEFVLSDGFELDLSVSTAEAENVLVTVWNNMVPLTVAKPIAVK